MFSRGAEFTSLQVYKNTKNKNTTNATIIILLISIQRSNEWCFSLAR